MANRQVWTEFQGALERRDGRTVSMLFHVGGAQVQKGIGQTWVDLGCFAKLRDLHIDLVLFARFETGLEMLQGVGRSRLPCE